MQDKASIRKRFDELLDKSSPRELSMIAGVVESLERRRIHAGVLTERQRQILEVLKGCDGMTAKDIASSLIRMNSLADSKDDVKRLAISLQNHDLKALRLMGIVANRAGLGYFVPEEAPKKMLAILNRG